jgi:hypothetical protein
MRLRKLYGMSLKLQPERKRRLWRMHAWSDLVTLAMAVIYCLVQLRYQESAATWLVGCFCFYLLCSLGGVIFHLLLHINKDKALAEKVARILDYTPRLLGYWMWRFLTEPAGRFYKLYRTDFNRPEVILDIIDYLEHHLLKTQEKVAGRIQEGQKKVRKARARLRELINLLEAERSAPPDDLDNLNMVEALATEDRLKQYDDALAQRLESCQNETQPFRQLAGRLRQQYRHAVTLREISLGHTAEDQVKERIRLIDRSLTELNNQHQQSLRALCLLDDRIRTEAAACLTAEYSTRTQQSLPV